MGEPPKKMDPGWNDPPMLSYSASNPPPKSRIMNKRVAFPLDGAASSAGRAAPGAPPPPLTTPPNVTLENFSKVWKHQANPDLQERFEEAKRSWKDLTLAVQKNLHEISVSLVEKDFALADQLLAKLRRDGGANEAWTTVLDNCFLSE